MIEKEFWKIQKWKEREKTCKILLRYVSLLKKNMYIILGSNFLRYEIEKYVKPMSLHK